MVTSQQLELTVIVTDLVSGLSLSEVVSDRDEVAMNALLKKVCSTPHLLWDEKGRNLTVVWILSYLQGSVALYQFPFAALTLKPFTLAKYQFSSPLVAATLNDLTTPLPTAEVICKKKERFVI